MNQEQKLNLSSVILAAGDSLCALMILGTLAFTFFGSNPKYAQSSFTLIALIHTQGRIKEGIESTEKKLKELKDEK